MCVYQRKGEERALRENLVKDLVCGLVGAFICEDAQLGKGHPISTDPTTGLTWTLDRIRRLDLMLAEIILSRC